MNFTALQTEFFARGFDYLNADTAGQTRAKQWLNDSYHEICALDDWPFLENDQSGAAPLTITDLRTVLSVLETVTSRELPWVDRRRLADVYGTVSTSGTPQYYYVDASNIVKTFPTGGTLSVRYIKTPTDLSAGADTPVVPTRFHTLIVDGAVRRGYVDMSQFAEAEAVEAERQRGLMVMRATLMGQIHRGQGRELLDGSAVPRPVQPVEQKER